MRILSVTDLPFIKNRKLRWALLLLLASVPLLGWWSTGLLDLDEGFYGAVTRAMIRQHEWITPYYRTEPWFEKPILIYWLTKPAVMLFGEDFGPRLPSVLATVATYALVAWFARRRWGGLAAVFSLFVLSSSLLTVAVGRMLMTDAVLVLFLTAAMLSFWESLVGNPKWRHVTAACLGFAVLAKGPVALLLFALIAGISYWRLEEMRDRYRGEWAVGTCVLLAVILVWYLPAYLANGQVFVQEFLVRQNLGRFTGGDAAHTLKPPAGLVFYIPILLLGMFPWILWLPSAWPSKGAPNLDRYLLIWAATIFGFFTVSSAKLPHYVLPCCPPLALLIGSSLARRWQSREAARPKLALAVVWLAVITVVANVGFSLWYRQSGQAEAHSLARWLRKQGGPVAVFQLPRRNKSLGTGKPKLQETSLPSLSFYLNEDVIQAEDIGDLKPPVWVFTRTGRITTDVLREVAAHGHFLMPARMGENYQIYQLR